MEPDNASRCRPSSVSLRHHCRSQLTHTSNIQKLVSTLGASSDWFVHTHLWSLTNIQRRMKSRSRKPFGNLTRDETNALIWLHSSRSPPSACAVSSVRPSRIANKASQYILPVVENVEISKNVQELDAWIMSCETLVLSLLWVRSTPCS